MGIFPDPLGKGLISLTTQTSAPTHLELLMAIVGTSLDEWHGLRTARVFRIQWIELRFFLG
jgi:hypothetical protein